MPLDIYSTHTQLMLVREIVPNPTFLRDRYFPTNDNTDVFATDDVLIEYMDGNRKIAPFVAPRKGGVTILREGYTMKRFTPPNIAPRRILTVDELQKRGFGEALFSKMTPAEREGALLMRDHEDLTNMIVRREEVMAAETIVTNGCIMKHIADDVNKADEMEIRFYDGENNTAVYTPAVPWDGTGAKWRDDAYAMARMLAARGLPVTELLVASDVSDFILNDPELKKDLDIQGYHIGGVDPAILPSGVSKIARLNFKGRMLDILSYEESYTGDDGQSHLFIPSGTVIAIAPGVGRTLYGSVTQLEQSDNDFHTYTGRRIPKYLANSENNTRTLTLTSRPLMIPNNKTPWIVAKVFEGAA